MPFLLQEQNVNNHFFYLRYGLQFLLVLPVPNPVHKSSQLGGLFFTAFVITSDQFRQLLVIMENQISVSIFTRHSVGPQFFHEEHLIGELWGDAISCRSSFSYPVCQVANEVEKEIAFRDGDYLNMDGI